MRTARTAVITVVHGRHDHLALQAEAWRLSTIAADMRCVVAIEDIDAEAFAGVDCTVLHIPACPDGLPLSAARNHGAQWALNRGADLLVFLDVDCLPSPDMLARYRDAHARNDVDALLSGPVTYLPPPPATGYRLDSLATLTDPHPARPDPPPGTLQRSDDYDLFWSLSFAISAFTWCRIGGFCEEYVGYGGEDTDFAATARGEGVPLVWVGGAHAYHQYHPVSDPPVEHLDAIVRNARVFHRRWGRWPMTGWLDAFEERGLLERTGAEIVVCDVCGRQPRVGGYS